MSNTFHTMYRCYYFAIISTQTESGRLNYGHVSKCDFGNGSSSFSIFTAVGVIMSGIFNQQLPPETSCM